jgi:hypothetical protein
MGGAYLTCRISAADADFAKAQFDQLEPAIRERVLSWIEYALEPARGVRVGSTYGLKHVLEKRTGVYLDNYQMAGAMLACGLEASDRPVSKELPEGGIPQQIDHHGNWFFRAKWTRVFRADERFDRQIGARRA